MKHPLVLLVVALVGCASLVGSHRPVQDVLATPQQFNGRAVRVCGWFISDMETCTLSRVAGVAGLVEEDTVWVTPSSGICRPINAFRKPRATRAVVDGTFYTGGGYGHFGLHQHTLVGGTVSPIRGACNSAGSAPNNSFKPKPLRGSA